MHFEQEITEEDITYILQNRKELLTIIREKKKMMYMELTERDDMLEAISLGGGIKRFHGKTNQHKEMLLQTIQKEQKLMEESCLLFREQLIQLEIQEETIHRIWICYQELPFHQYRWMKERYVKHEKFAYVKQQMTISQREAIVLKQEAIENILALYLSDYSNRGIIRKKYLEKNSKVVLKDSSKYRKRKSTAVKQRVLKNKENNRNGEGTWGNT